ncbi:uncharacterized protein LOC110645548 isoform X1 [Hevea brasiliensis]|uniref:uncharacterized protein LOC110645548 isoform X1 n=1 Tax=Hevea brasiliensis TaxID=3981 RepID=UPI0025EEE626|nr:uncharacterized protein LOC110645548 isoform X1 [Hevea brasiliensis]
MAIPNSAVLLFSVFFSCNWYWILLVIPVLAMLVFIACPLLALSSLVEEGILMLVVQKEVKALILKMLVVLELWMFLGAVEGVLWGILMLVEALAESKTNYRS